MHQIVQQAAPFLVTVDVPADLNIPAWRSHNGRFTTLALHLL